LFTDGGPTAIDPFLDCFPRYNVLRCFDYTPAADWGTDAWESIGIDAWCAFLAYVAPRGWYVEGVLLTDDDPGRIPHARELVQALTGTVGFLPEIGNEPTTHKSIDTPALRHECESSGLMFASGDYEAIDLQPARNFGRYTNIHTPRDGEWPRKAKDLLEFYQGWGPWEEGGEGSGGVKHPAFAGVRRPCVADEPIRPDQAGFAALDFYAYAAVASLMGAGATFHFKPMKYGRLPRLEEQACADAFARGLDVFPADAPLGNYGRIDEHGATLRTYTMGNHYMVRIRPQTFNAPESEWTPLDEFGICWTRP
jgi:hypothetical protein